MKNLAAKIIYDCGKYLIVYFSKNSGRDGIFAKTGVGDMHLA